MADLTAQQKKDYARTLYLKDNLTQQEIADKVGVSRKTVNRWVTVEKWEEMRVGMTLTKEQQVASLHRQVAEINRRHAEQAGNSHQEDGNRRRHCRYHQRRHEVHQLAASVRSGQE